MGYSPANAYSAQYSPNGLGASDSLSDLVAYSTQDASNPHGAYASSPTAHASGHKTGIRSLFHMRESNALTALLQAWLLFLSLFEIPNVYKTLVDPAPLDGFASNLRGGTTCAVGAAGSCDALYASAISSAALPTTPERRLWAFMLSLLVASRLAAASAPRSPIMLTHCAAVHILEFICLGGEVGWYGARGSGISIGGYDAVVLVMLANAFLFTVIALGLSSMSVQDRVATVIWQEGPVESVLPPALTQTGSYESPPNSPSVRKRRAKTWSQ